MSETYVYYHVTKPGAVLRAKGPDAFTFLQSQFANDLHCPEVEQPVTYGLWLDHKGKIQADSFVLQKSPGEFLIVSYDGPRERLRAHLEARLVADDVTLEDETEKYSLVHLWPAEHDDDLSELVGQIADPALTESWMGRRPTGFGAWDLLAPPPVMEKIVAQLNELGVANATMAELAAIRVALGIPAVPADAGLEDLPQETGLQLVAVSYDKGCYLGQEVMQRLHTQGHANRALWQVAWEGGLPEPQQDGPLPLFVGETEAGQLRSRATKDGKSLGLAMLKLRLLAGQPLLSFSPNGPKIVRLFRNLAEG